MEDAMRALAALALGATAVLAPAIAAAEDAETLRRELEQMRQQFETMKEQYRKSMEDLSDRLRRIEAQPAPPAVPSPVQAPPVSGPPGTAATAPPGIPLTAQELLQPRQPFSLYGRRGAGQLLFDMGVAGDFVGNLTQDNVQKARGGSFPGLENRFFPREVEFNFFGQIDPYARAEVRIETGEEERGGEATVRLAEAFFQLLTLPYGTQAQIGQMRNRFGYSNQVHEHDLAWVDRPNVFRNFFGDEGLVERGAEFTLVPPLPFYLEALVGVFDGDNETSFGRGSLRYPLVTGRLRTFLELDDANAVQLGASAASGEDPDRLRSTVVGFDLRYKFRPEGWLHPLITVTGEALWSFRKQNVAVDVDGDDVPDVLEKRRRDRSGWYAGLEVQPWRRWAVGARYDWSQLPLNPGREWAVEPYLTFWPSEFLRFRLAYKRTERSQPGMFDFNGGSARIADEVLFQGTFILGAHPAHPF
jgi:opacity protein-like surface antigen